MSTFVRAVTRTPKSSHITHVPKSLHWLKINERIKYKLLSLTYKFLTTHQPQYLHNSISVQPCHNTRSSSMVTLARPPTHSSLKITNRSFRYAVPSLWNELPTDLREPRHTVSCTFSYHTWQFIIFTIFTIFTITACIFSYSLNHCIGNCVRLSRLLVGFRMHFKSLHFHSFHVSKIDGL